jgi:uncharacterized glyoxalase superfamily protein PhnB
VVLRLRRLFGIVAAPLQSIISDLRPKERPMTAVDSIALKQLTPVMVVEAVEPCLPFWTDRLGFTVENELPGPDGKLIFASAKRGDIEVMYQTRASVLSENPGMAEDLKGHSVTLFITVDNFDAVANAMQGAPVVKDRHDTFYGSTEIYVREPGGNTVGFAAFK